MLPVSLIIPALNEAKTLPLLAKRLPTDIEVIVVDNGSSDDTALIAKNLGYKVISEPRRGYGAAVWAGSQAASKQILVYASADGSDPVEQLQSLVIALENGALVSSAARITTAGEMNWLQTIGNRLLCYLIHLRWGVHFQDIGPFRAIRRDTLDMLNMTDRGFGWTIEMQIKAASSKLSWKEIPLPYQARQAGRSKISGTIRGSISASIFMLWTFCWLAVRLRA
ncbi:MAG: glycosyltransferase family 2 protein [Alphaproteobacteria bacterium]